MIPEIDRQPGGGVSAHDLAFEGGTWAAGLRFAVSGDQRTEPAFAGVLAGRGPGKSIAS